MLDPRCKSLRLIFSFIGRWPQLKNMIGNPYFLCFYHHLHPLFEVESSLAYKIDENKSLDIF